jgi:hypothetical protein
VNNMTPLLKKLNYKDQPSILVVNSPKSFDSELKEMANLTKITKTLSKAKDIEFAMCFATTQAEIDGFVTEVYPKLKGDATIWLCYPKMSSKNYKCEFNRDTGWAIAGQYNLEPVRQVAIDDDFSALRFRKVEYIKTITRRESYALTTDAKKRTSQKGK